jgi:hypothetical protein
MQRLSGHIAKQKQAAAAAAVDPSGKQCARPSQTVAPADIPSPTPPRCPGPGTRHRGCSTCIDINVIYTVAQRRTAVDPSSTGTPDDVMGLIRQADRPTAHSPVCTRDEQAGLHAEDQVLAPRHGRGMQLLAQVSETHHLHHTCDLITSQLDAYDTMRYDPETRVVIVVRHMAARHRHPCRAHVPPRQRPHA